jgi:hypothetical protein
MGLNLGILVPHRYSVMNLSGPTGPMGWVSQPPTLKGFDVLVELSNQLTHTGKMIRIDSLGHSVFPVPRPKCHALSGAMHNMSRLPDHTQP